MDRDEMSNLYRGPSIDASYQVSVHLALWFQRRRFLEIDQSETRIACGSQVCEWNLWHGELKTLASTLFRQFGRCLGFLSLQDKYNICTLPLNIKSIYTPLPNRPEKLAKDPLFYLFLKLIQN
jgi:hypothetical protein